MRKRTRFDIIADAVAQHAADEPTRLAVMAQGGQQCAWSGYAKKIAAVKTLAQGL